MYFAYGWPKVLAVREEGAPQDDVVYLSLDDDFFVAVSTVCIQLWSGGQHRVRLGILRRGPDSVASEGLNRRAFWCGARRLLAVLTYGNVLHVYGLHWTKEPALPLGSCARLPPRLIDILLEPFVLRLLHRRGAELRCFCDRCP